MAWMKRRQRRGERKQPPYGLQILVIGGIVLLGMLIGKLPWGLFSTLGGLMTGAGAWAALAAFTWDILQLTGLADCLQSLSRKELIRIGLFFLLTNLFLILFITSERYVKFWDQSAYWKRTIRFMETLYTDPLEAVRQTWYTMNHMEYNQLISLFLAFPMKLTGVSFLSFILWVWNLFSLPAVLIMELMMKKLRPGYQIGCLEVLAVPMLLIIIVEGFGDSLGMLFAVLAMALLTDGKYYEEFDLGRCFFVFASAMCSMLARRYFGPFAVGYVTGILVSYLGKKEREPVEFFKNLACTGLFTAAGMAVCHGFVKMSLFTDYSLQYSAYRTAGMGENFVLAMESFGAVTLVLALLGLWQLAREEETRRFGLFLAVQIVVTSAAVFYILDLYIHQYYVIIPGMLLLAMSGLHWLAQRRNRVGLGIAGALLIFNFANSFLDFHLPAPVSLLCSSQIRTPQIRHDMDQIGQMVADLNGLLGNEDGSVDWSEMKSGNGKTVYCIASSDTLNYEVIRHYDMPEKLEAVPGLLGTYDVDLRDGFPQSFLTADYLLVTDPPQYHLLEDGQRTVVLLDEEFLNGGPLAEHFRQIKSYQLDDGVTVYLLERISPYEEEDIRYLQEMFDRYYSDFPEIFHDRIVMPQ